MTDSRHLDRFVGDTQDATGTGDEHSRITTRAPAGSQLSARWRSTPAHVRAVALGLLMLAVGVLLRRPDAVALGTPLVVVAAWSVLRRPTATPTVHAWLRHSVLREGQTTAWTAIVEPGDGVEDVGLSVTETDHTRYTPTSLTVSVGDVGRSARQLDVLCESTRWGLRRLGPATCAVSSAFGAFTWEPEQVEAPLVPTVPLPATFSGRTPVPDPDGLVGRSRSRHQGDGSEIADVRAFRFGDRLRRIHWPVSVRTGELHVTTTHADQDSEILILVDAMQDLGRSSGFDGDASSLDNGVRAAAAVAEHYLRVGDRVGLQALGAHESPRLPPAPGSNQLRRLLDVLARVRVADGGVVDHRRLRGQLRHPVSAGTLVVILTPAVSVEVLAHACALARQGRSTVVVDTLPRTMSDPRLPDELLDGLVPGQGVSTAASLAWRLRLLERARELARTRQSGVPIVIWDGPGTLDLVLRDIGRQRRSPRVRSR
ncbi:MULTISPECIES: DUF58 domain-containing protein [unclassified Knoellia]|uniref:DUF58 domain-containing protein n=1 Tax=Knoellia altitudinis TaxID=3404795 RepID=UPI00361FD9B4